MHSKIHNILNTIPTPVILILMGSGKDSPEFARSSTSTMSSQYASGDELLYQQHVENIGFIPIQNDSTSYESVLLTNSNSSYSARSFSTQIDDTNSDYGISATESHSSLDSSKSPYFQTIKDIRMPIFKRPDNNFSIPPETFGLERSKNGLTVESSEKIKHKFLLDQINKLKVPKAFKPVGSVITEDEIGEEKETFLTKKLQMLEKRIGTDKNDLNSIPKNSNEIVPELVPCQWLENIRIANVFNNLQKIKETPIHTPRNFSNCRLLIEDFNQAAILKSIIRRLQFPLMEEKIQEHLITHTSINLIGEASRSLPPFSDYKTNACT